MHLFDAHCTLIICQTTSIHHLVLVIRRTVTLSCMPMMHHIVLAMKSFRDTVSPLLVNKRNASVLTSFSVARIDGRAEGKTTSCAISFSMPTRPNILSFVFFNSQASRYVFKISSHPATSLVLDSNRTCKILLNARNHLYISKLKQMW